MEIYQIDISWKIWSLCLILIIGLLGEKILFNVRIIRDRLSHYVEKALMKEGMEKKNER